MEPQCSEGDAPAVYSCFCSLPLPKLCSKHLSQHPMDTEGFLHFHLPVAAAEAITSKEDKKKHKLKLFKLKSAYGELTENQRELSEFEEKLKRLKTEIVLAFEADIEARISESSQKVAALRAAYEEEVRQATAATMTHALEQWKPEAGSLAELVWNFEPTSSDLKLFESWVGRGRSSLSESFQLSFRVKLPSLAALGQSLQASVDEAQEARAEAERYRSEVERVAKSMKELAAEKAAMLQEIAKFRSSHTKLSELLASSKTRIQQLTEEKELLQAEKDTIASQVAELKEALEASQRESARGFAENKDIPRGDSAALIRRLSEEKEMLKAQMAAQAKRFVMELEALKTKNTAETKRLSVEMEGERSGRLPAVTRTQEESAAVSRTSFQPSHTTSPVADDMPDLILPLIYRKTLRFCNLQTGEMTASILPASFSVSSVFCLLDESTVLCAGGHNPIIANAYLLNMLTCALTPTESMVFARFSPGIIKHGRFAYVFGGWDSERNLTSCEKFNPSSQNWTQLDSMKHGRSHFSPCAQKKDIYLPDVAKPHKVLEVFNVVSEDFSALSIKIPESLSDFSVSFILDGDLVIVTRDRQVGRLRLNGLSQFRLKQARAEKAHSGLTNVPPVKVGREVLWVNHDTGSLIKYQVDLAVITSE